MDSLCRLISNRTKGKNSSRITDYISHKPTRHVLEAYVTCDPSFRLKCKWIHDTVVWRKSNVWKTVNVHKTTDAVLTP